VTTRKRKLAVTIEFVKQSAYFIGTQRDMMPHIRASGAPWQWSHSRRAVGVPVQYAGEVEARLVAAGYVVRAQLVAP